MQINPAKAGVVLSDQIKERIEKIMKDTPKQKLEEARKKELDEKIDLYLQQIQMITPQ